MRKVCYVVLSVVYPVNVLVAPLDMLCWPGVVLVFSEHALSAY